MFLRHVAEDGPWPYGLEAGAKGVQLAELGLKSWAERRWLDVPALEYLSHGRPSTCRGTARIEPYTTTGTPVPLAKRSAADFPRIAYGAAHVVADPLADNDPWLTPAIDWERTLAFRHRLWDLGLGVAEAMDTAQRGMGLGWPEAQELIRRALAEAQGPPRRADRLRRRHRPPDARAGRDHRRRAPRLRGADRGWSRPPAAASS